jgi:hypothetical protein
MGVLKSVKGLFQRRRSLAKITMDELQREKIRLEHEEARRAKRVEELERQKRELFLRGKDEPSERQRRILATKIKELDVQAKNMDKQLRFISKQLRIVNGFIQIKENQRLLDQLGVSGIISRLDIQTLQKYVEDASIEGRFQWEKFEGILRTLEETEKVIGELEEDRDILEIMRAMEETKAAEMEAPEKVEEIAMQRLEEILREPEETEF